MKTEFRYINEKNQVAGSIGELPKTDAKKITAQEIRQLEADGKFEWYNNNHFVNNSYSYTRIENCIRVWSPTMRRWFTIGFIK